MTKAGSSPVRSIIFFLSIRSLNQSIFIINDISFLFILGIICDNVTVVVTDTNITITTQNAPATDGTTKDVSTQKTTTTNAPININATEAIVIDMKEKAVFNNTKKEAIIRTNDNVLNVYAKGPAAHNTESVFFHKHPTVRPSTPTEESNVLKIANELKLLEKLTAILPGVLDEKINNNQNNENETAKKDLEVFEQYSLSHYLDPEAEVVVFRKNERSQRQISDFPPQKHILDANNRTETHIFKLLPQIIKIDIDNNADRSNPIVYDTVNGNRKLSANAPLPNRALYKDVGSQKLIPDTPKSDFSPILHLSQCNSCIASLNKINWNLPEPIKIVNNQKFDIIQSDPLQIPNTDMLKSQNSFESDKGHYVYLEPTLQNPHVLEGYRRINHINKHLNGGHNKHTKSQLFRARDDDPSEHYGIDKILNNNNKNTFVPNMAKDNNIFLDILNNPYGDLQLPHTTSNKMFTNAPDLSNMYPWLLGGSSVHSAQRSQPLPSIHSLLMVNEPELTATLAPVVPNKFSQLTINKDKFDYYDSLVNMISKKNRVFNNIKHSAIEPLHIMSDTSIKDAANEKLVLKINEFRQNLAKLKPLVVDRQERRDFENQKLLLDRKINTVQPIQYLKMDNIGAQSNKMNPPVAVNSANDAKFTLRASLSNANEPPNFQSATGIKLLESYRNEATEKPIEFTFELPPIEIDIAKRRAMDSNIEGNHQRELTVPLETLIKQLLQANGFDKDKIELFWPQFVALLGNHIAYLPKYKPYYSSSQIQNSDVPNLPKTDNMHNVDLINTSNLKVISNVTDTEDIAQSSASKRDNETTITVKYNVTDAIQNTIQSLLAFHNITNNSDTISVSTTILLDVTDNGTSLDPKDIRRHLEIIKIENNANNASVLLLNKKNYDEILKSLDSFTLERKKAYATVVPSEKATEYMDIGRSKDNRTADPTILDNIFGKKYVSEKEVTIGPAKEEAIDTKDILDNPQVFSALKKQTELMGQLLLKLRGENARKNAGKDFQDLIKEVEAKKHGTFTTEIIEDLNKRIGDETKTPPTTVMTMIDETEVRKALRNSPYVKRILKLSKQKRDRYFQGKKTSERKKY